MESEAFHITNPQLEFTSIEFPTLARSGPARAVRIERRRNPRVRLRLGLQGRADRNSRRRLLRGVERLLVLIIADLASFYVMRALLRAVRDDAIFGNWIAERVFAILPTGILSGWQFAAAILVALLVSGNYGPGDQRRSLRRLFLGCALATALPLWMTIWTRGLELVAVQYILISSLVWLGLVSERMSIDHATAWIGITGRSRIPTLFVGPAEDCRETMRGPAFDGNLEYRILGFVDVHNPPRPGAFGHIVDFAQVLHDSGAEAVVICGYLTDPSFHDVVEASLIAGCRVLSAPRAIAVAGVQPTVVWRRSQVLIELTRPTLKRWQLVLKRIVDVMASAAGLLLLSPVLGLIAVAVKLESPGPAMFGHRRLGKDGRPFRCYKFRSMHADAELRLRSDVALYREYLANSYKLAEHRDPRVTRIGRFLRKTSLDELPQLLNVLVGDMSLVGPRPIVPQEIDEYGTGAPSFLSLKPGITGAWQVNGRSALGYPDRAGVELEYVRNWSLGRDLDILLRTFPVVFGRRGAH